MAYSTTNIEVIRRVAPSYGSVLIAVVFCSGDVPGDESRNVPFVIPPDMPIEEIKREATRFALAFGFHISRLLAVWFG